MLPVETLNQHVTSDDFDGEAALSLLQAKASIDFGDSRTPGPEYASRANQELFVFTPTYFLDYLSLIGLPLRAITPDHSHCLAGIKINVSFRHWAIPYAGKHNKQLGFTLQNRTFRIGSISSGETWFIVLHPRSILPDVYDNAKARKRTALLHHHAKQLSNYIISIFESSEIPGQRVEPSWKLNGSEDCDLELDVWGLFQKKFMENWSHFISDSNTPEVANDQFWQVNVPAFHAYQYGQNTPVNVTTEVENYPQEPVDPQIISDSLDTQHSDSEYDSDSDRESDRDERSNNGDGPASPIHTPSGSVRTAETSLRSLLSRLPPDDGVLKFTNYLQDRYKVENLHFVSYALAADIHCETGDNYGKCCLIDRKRLSHLFPTGRGFNPSFWPLALNQRYGNVTADKPPEFIQNHAYAVLKANLYQENGREILHDNYFQGYSKVQRHFRFNPDDLLADKGISTGALALPKSERGKRQKIRNIHDRLVNHILGPESGKPLAREKQRVTRAIAKRDFAFRLEQIVTIDVKALLPVNKHAETLIRPMLQLIRVFNLEQKYIKIFRVFEPSVFPGILCTFSRLFEVAIGYITDYFVQNKLEYVGVPAAEYVSLLDRVAAYMFTGSAKYLKPSVMRKLGTMDALKKFAFPYIDPGMLQVCPQTYLNIEKWPKDDRGRPNLLQTAALGYYYGKTVRSGRESSIYFEYFKNAIQAPAEAMEYLVDLLKEQMLPETSRFIGRQLLRAIGDDKNQNRAAKTNHRELVSTWENAENPFSKQ
jgi:hypothetical protein